MHLSSTYSYLCKFVYSCLDEKSSFTRILYSLYVVGCIHNSSVNFLQFSATNGGSISFFFQFPELMQFRGVQAHYINIGGGVGGEIPDNKRLQYALQHIHGIGRSKAHHIVCELGVENKYVKDLSKRELYSLRELLSKYMLGNDLVLLSLLILLTQTFIPQ